jgi:hypothetical protein
MNEEEKHWVSRLLVKPKERKKGRERREAEVGQFRNDKVDKEGA